MLILDRPRPCRYQIGEIDKEAWAAPSGAVCTLLIRLHTLLAQLRILTDIEKVAVQRRLRDTDGPFPIGNIKAHVDLGGIEAAFGDQEVPDGFVELTEHSATDRESSLPAR